MEKLNPDDTGVHEPVSSSSGDAPDVKRLNRRLIAGVAGSALAVLAIAFVWSVQTKAENKATGDEEEAQHTPAQNPTAMVDGLIKESERQKPLSLQDELKKEEQLAEAEAIQQALEAGTLEAEDEQKKVEDPWEKARQQARQRNAQTYFQDAHGARKSSVFASVGKPSGSGATSPQGEVEFDVAHERGVQASRMKEFEAGQNAPDVVVPVQAQGNAKEEFFNRKHDGATRSFASLEVPMSDYALQAGTILPLVLETAIDSDLPGFVKSRVASPVYDTVTGRHLLIPSGSVVVGEYSSSQEFGQNRLQVAWTRLILPNGKSLSLGNLPGVSLDGASGVSDQVDEHWNRIIAGALFSSALAGAGAAAGGNRNEQNVRPDQEALSGAASQIVKSGDALTAKNLELEPTIRIRAGMRVSAFVREDLILEPYEGDR